MFIFFSSFDFNVCFVSTLLFYVRFVGMLPQDQLQQFIVRTVTGYGDRVQAAEVTEVSLKEITAKISVMAGMATMTIKKKAKLYEMVEGALELEGGMGPDGALTEAVKTALVYINNAAKDARVSLSSML
jgi:hypothetical protein